MPTSTAASPFKSAAAADVYRAAYAATLALWPVPSQPLDVTTSFGVTHLNAAGALDLPPLILIHGFAVSSTQWYANVAPLSQHYRVYALDVVNQMGLSVCTRPLTTRAQCAAWLGEVLAGLGLERATLMGHSYGGWLALNLALAQPARVERLVLLSPAAAFGPVATRYLLSFLLSVFVPTRSNLYRFMQSSTTQPVVNGRADIEQVVAGVRGFKQSQLASPVVVTFTDAELRRLGTPALLLVGEYDISCRPSAVLERARRLVPRLEAELIRGGGHLFQMDQAAATNARLLQFLTAPMAAPAVG
jgi:pimeloyl-ACP methyl ester carboxylesterase